VVTKKSRLPVIFQRLTPGQWSAYVGLVTCAVGFGLIAVAWGKVAGELNVALQMPYVVSAAITGLGLIMVGLTVVLVAVNRLDNRKREAQLREVVAELRELRATLNGTTQNGSSPVDQPHRSAEAVETP
jgi:hypothetical protein